jgi:hypothetical protein
MFQLGKTIVSEDILGKDFVCNLSPVKVLVARCGCSFERGETKILEEIYPKVKPFYANKELLLSKRELGP